MEYVRFNMNCSIKVKLTQDGIMHLLKKRNENVPVVIQTSFREIESRKDAQGYHSFQMHDFIDNFGDLGFNATKYFELWILISKNDLEEVK